MNSWVKIAVVAGLWMIHEALAGVSVQAAETADVKTRAERSFDQLKHHQEEATNKSSLITPTSEIGYGMYSRSLLDRARPRRFDQRQSGLPTGGGAVGEDRFSQANSRVGQGTYDGSCP